jgi:NAD(P)H dehydrogenase (quinone)
MTNSRTLLVTGASGQLGRRVVTLLADAGADRLVATTRNPFKIADLANRGVVVRRGDFDDPQSLTAAFEGADRLLLVSTDAIDFPGRRIEQHRAAIHAAKAAGVSHIVYTSFAEPDPHFLVSADHWATEQALAASGLGWTALRHNLYTEFLAQLLPEAIASGEIVAAAGEGGAAFVTREDCARAAAAALASTETSSRVLEIAGPAIVTVHDVARLASDLAGRPVSYVPVVPAALRVRMVAAGVSRRVADVLVSIHVAMAQGKFRAATSAVADLTGRIPTSVPAFLSAKRDALLAAPVAH